MRAVAFFTLSLLALAASPSEAQVRLASARQPAVLSGRFVVLDAGHGGVTAPGTSSRHWPEGLSESEVTYALATRVRRLLEARGVPVRMTRTRASENPSLESRAAECTSKCALFVSIHINAMPTDPHPSYGLEAYIPTNPSLQSSSQIAAERLLHGVAKATGQPILRIQPRGLGVLRSSTRPAVLLEMGFATHPVEGPWLLQSSTQHTMAQAIARAIQQMVTGTTTGRYVSRPIQVTPARPAPAPRGP